MCPFVTICDAQRKWRKLQKAKQTHLSGLVPLGLSKDYQLQCVYLKMLKTSNSSRIINQCVMLKYNLLIPDHSIPHAQLVYTKQHDMHFMCHFLNPTLHRGIWVSQGNQSSCNPAVFSHSDFSKGNCHLPVAPYNTFNAKGFEDS